ncbi:MAG: DMT family transporter [bacterium]
MAVFLIYSLADTIIKGLGGTLPIWEISFFVSAFGLIAVYVTKPRSERWRDALKPRNPWLLNLRCMAGYLATMLIIYAFVHVSMAEVYSLVFLTPVFVVLISIAVLKERVDAVRWLVLAVSLIGSLLVIKPGFQVFQLGHLAAVGHAILAASTSLMIKRLAATERQTAMMVFPALYAILLNGAIMAFDFVMPTAGQWLGLGLAGCLAASGNLLFIFAGRITPISRLQLAHYSQIVWGAMLGALIYKEMPDVLAFVGIVVILGAGLMNVVISGRPTLESAPTV